MIELVQVFFDVSLRDWCRRPYPGHPKGCPNYGERPTCPPEAPLLGDVLNLLRPVWAVWVEFDLEAQRKRMWLTHPKWSKRQAECCRYWQGGVRKRLRAELLFHQIALEETGLVDIEVPEAMGVNVTETMRGIGVDLEWPVEKIDRHVGLIGYRKETSK